MSSFFCGIAVRNTCAALNYPMRPLLPEPGARFTAARIAMPGSVGSIFLRRELPAQGAKRAFFFAWGGATSNLT